MSRSDYKNIYEGYLDNTGYNNRNIRERYGGCGTSPIMEKYVDIFKMPHVTITSNNKTYVIVNYRSSFSGSDYGGYVSAEGVTEKFTFCSQIRSLTDTGITTITAKFMDPLDTASNLLNTYYRYYIPQLYENSINGPLVKNVTISFDKEDFPTKIIYTINGCSTTFVAPPAPPSPTTTTPKTKVTGNLSIFPNRSSWKVNDKLVMKDEQTNDVLRGSITTIYSSAASGKLNYDITFTNNIKKFYPNMPPNVRADMSNGSPDTSLLIWS